MSKTTFKNSLETPLSLVVIVLEEAKEKWIGY